MDPDTLTEYTQPYGFNLYDVHKMCINIFEGCVDRDLIRYLYQALEGKENVLMYIFR